MGERIGMPISYEKCLEQFLSRLLTVKTNGIIGNLFGLEVIVRIQQVVSSLGHPLPGQIRFSGHRPSSLLVTL